MCRVREWNLSYGCLTSFNTRKRLWEMKDRDPEFWKELTEVKTVGLPAPDVTMPEDEPDREDQLTDDSELPLNAVIEEIINGTCPDGIAHCPTGGLMSVADAERLDLEPEPDVVASQDVETKDTKLGRGKRHRTENKLYTSSTFWRHHDDDDWVADERWAT